MIKALLSTLSLGLYKPDYELGASKVFSNLASEVDPKLAKCLNSMQAELDNANSDEQAFEDLLVDYTRLFLSPQSLAKPYLTNWKDKLGDDVVERYLSFLHGHGLAVEEDVEDLPEHIAIALEVHDLLDDAVKQKYVEEFIVPIYFDWIDLIEKNAQTNFYKNWALALRYTGEGLGWITTKAS